MGFTQKPKSGLITPEAAFNCVSSFFVETDFDFWASAS